jgi:hypothetical protein
VILTKDLSQGIKGTGHHSVVQVPGTDDWYIAYHRFAMPSLDATGNGGASGDGTHRETTVDRLSFNPDGTIQTVIPTLTSVAPVVVPDLAAPVTSVALSPAAPVSGWYTGPVQVSVTAQDAHDGAVVPLVRVTGPGFNGDWLSQSAPLALVADGVYQIDYRAVDAIGNSSPVKSVTVRVDATAPVSKATIDPKARTVTLVAADATSGLALLEFSLDGGTTWTAYHSAITLGAAAGTVTYRAVDVAGNREHVNQASLPAVGIPLAPSTTKASITPARIVVGTSATVKVSVSGALPGARPTGVVRITLGSAGGGSVEVGSARLSDGTATITLPAALTRNGTIAVGKQSLSVTYSGDQRYAASLATLTLTVTKAASHTRIKISPKTIKVGTSMTADVQVTADHAVPVQGTVTVRVFNGVRWTDYTVRVGRGGKARIRLARATRAGTYLIRAAYSGSDQLKTSKAPEQNPKVKR